MAQNICRLQGSSGVVPVLPSGLSTLPVGNLDEMAMEIVKCCEGLELKEVCTIKKCRS